MICPNCGNELGPEEVFCGQCGAQTLPSVKPTEMVQTPPAQSGLVNNAYNTQPMSGASYVPGMQSAQSVQSNQPPARPSGALPPNVPAGVPPALHQQGNFYHGATEAVSALPQAPGYPPGAAYPAPGMPGQGMYAPSSPQYGPPLQTGNYAGPQYPTAPGYRPGLTPPPPKRRSSAVMVIAVICLALAIIAFAAFGALYYLHSKNQPVAQVTPSPAVTATTVPSPTPSLNPSPNPSPSPSPSPALSPTPSLPPADNGFVYCTNPCAANGFITEFPQGWVQGTPDSTTITYTDPAQSDVYAYFRTPGTTTDTASTLVTNDLNTYYAKYGYTVVGSFNNRTIGGENWSYEIATYHNSGVTEQVEVYATVHNNNAFIIELQAPQSQFQTIDTSYFENMLNRFQFQS
jgi:hypothetical protein